MIFENETLQSHSKDSGLVHSWLTFIRPMDEWSELTSPSRFAPFIICLSLLQSIGVLIDRHNHSVDKQTIFPLALR